MSEKHAPNNTEDRPPAGTTPPAAGCAGGFPARRSTVRRRGRRKRFGAILTGSLVLLGAAAWYLYRPAEPPAAQPTVRVERRLWRPVLRQYGLLEARHEVSVFSGFNGEVIWKIEDGAAVKPGDPILRFDSQAVEDGIEQLEEDLAEREAELRQRERETALSTTEYKLLVERAEVERRMARLEYEEMLAGPTAAEKKKSRLRLRRTKLLYRRAREQLSGVEYLFSLGFAGRLELDRTRLEAAQAESAFAEARELDRLLPLKGGKDALRSAKLRLAKAEQHLAAAKVAAETAAAAARARSELARVSVDNIRRRMGRKKEELKNSVVRAPSGGRVAFVDIWKGSAELSPIQIGERVFHGMLLCKIADTSALRVKALFSEADALELPARAVADVKLPAFPGRIFSARRVAAPLTAEDKNLLLPKPALRHAGEAFVNAVVVRFEFINLTDAERNELRLGMTAALEIPLTEPHETAVVPWRAVWFTPRVSTDGKTEADQPFVLVRRNAAAEPQPVFVKLGLGDAFFAELKDGPPVGTPLRTWTRLSAEERRRTLLLLNDKSRCKNLPPRKIAGKKVDAGTSAR